MKIGDIAVDADRLENGAWVDDVPEMPGLRLKVRGSFNADWRKLQQKLLDNIPRKKRMGGRTDLDEQEAIMTKCLLNCCLLDWEGLEDESGKAIPYSKEFAQKLLSEPQYRRFRESVAWAANMVAEIKDEDQREAVGNLVKLSTGSTDGERNKKVG
jgi:hypothetical protein